MPPAWLKRPEPEAPVEPTYVAAPKPWRILLVVDDPELGELLARVFTADGNMVHRVTNQQAAILTLMNDQVDVVVAALHRAGPGSNLKLLDAIRSADFPQVSGARILLLAGKSANRLFTWESGVDGYLQHPFHVRELLRELAAVVNRPEDQRRRHRREQSELARRGGRPDPTLVSRPPGPPRL